MSEKNLTTGKIWIIIDVRRLNVMLKKISLFYKLVKKWSHTAVDGVLFSKDQKIIYRYPSAKTEIPNTVTAYTIPNTVTTIKSETFFSCQNLTSITIPHTVTIIENNAFYGVKKNMTISVKTEEIKNLLINSGFTGEVELVP